MWVASYGVMPQTYMRAVGPGAVGRTSPVAVSKRRRGSPVPGSVGTWGAGQACMIGEPSRGPSERRPRDAGPAVGRHREGRVGEQSPHPPAGGGDLARGEQRGQLLRQVTVEQDLQPLEHLDLLGGESLPGPAPE